MLMSLTACSKQEVQEKLNELLFVNKIIDIIELEEVETESSSASNIPTPPSENNPFIADKDENKTMVSGNDTFIYLNWTPTYGSETDLDLMVLLVGDNGKTDITNLINYNNFSSSDEVAVHMGDSTDESECVYLNLDNIPKNISKIIVYCYNYSNDWNKLSKLKLKIDSLNEKYETDIRAGNINPLDYGMEFGSSSSVSFSKSVSSAVLICSYERRGPIWYLNKDMVEIFDLNSQLSYYGVYTKDYSSAYLDEQARIAAEKEEQARLEAERLEQERQQAQQIQQENVNNNTENVVNSNSNNSTENESTNTSSNTNADNSTTNNTNNTNNTASNTDLVVNSNTNSNNSESDTNNENTELGNKPVDSDRADNP